MKNKKVILSIVVIIIILSILGGSLGALWIFNREGFEKIFKNAKSVVGIGDSNYSKQGLFDDWEYTPDKYDRIEGSAKSINSGSFVSTDAAANLNEANIGFSVGGAKNINNFRENIKNNYLPISTDITYNGLFYDYYFNTGNNNNEIKSNEMFYPTYSKAISKDPISGQQEFYMTVGLNSNIKQSDFKRKKLNLVVVMDISGSMSSSFRDYYYDRRNSLEEGNKDDSRSKMVIANESLNCLIDQLNPDDRLGIVLFDDSSYLAKPVNLISETDVDKIKEHILEIEPQGGTNFEAGYTKGTELFTDEMLNNEEYENRIIVITDAMPNLGETSKDGLTKYVKDNAKNGIYTSFVGVGVDFNTEVIECLSYVKGANYYSVHSSEEFKKIMGKEFDYMVTPLVFDLELKLDSNEFEIAGFYGTDTKDKSTGTIMKVNTLFPSSSNSEGEVKGGVILLKLKPLSYTTQYDKISSQKTNIVVSYKDVNGKNHTNEQKVTFGDIEEGYDNTGIRKAIVLTRYANLMKDWILYERMNCIENELDVIVKADKSKLLVTSETGIVDYPYNDTEDVRSVLGQNERTSQKLSVSEEYVDTLVKFKEYMKNEIKDIGDDDMNQEIEILDILVKNN